MHVHAKRLHFYRKTLEVLKSAGRLTAIGTMRNPVAKELRNLIAHVTFGFAPVQHAFATAMTEVAIGYADGSLNGVVLGGGPQPGERVVPSLARPPSDQAIPRASLWLRRRTPVWPA
jgi:hypothetical protein